MKPRPSLHLFCSHSANSIPMIPLLLGEWLKQMDIRVYHFHVAAFAALPEGVQEERFFSFPDRASSLQRGSVFNVKRNIWLLYKMASVLRAKGPRILYCIDDTSLKLLFLLLKGMGLPKDCRILYHEFENVDQLNKLFGTSLLNKKDFARISLAIAPEKNRLEKLLGNLGLSAGKGRMVPNTCYAIQASLPAKHPLFENLPKGKKIICHIGGLGDGSHYFKQVFEAIPENAIFLQVGTADQKIRDHVAQHPHRDRFVHAGQLPHAELARIYPYVDYGLILYKGINFNYEYCAPNKLYEFWSFGIPVIAHQLGGLQPLFDADSKGHLFNFDGPDLEQQLGQWLDSDKAGTDHSRLKALFDASYSMNHFAPSLGETIINLF